MTEERIVVCGSGIAGLASALGLTRAGFDVTLLGPQPSSAPPAGDEYHPRVYALSPSSRAFLDRLGVWALMRAERITPVAAMEVHGDAGGTVHLNAWQANQQALAWIVESSQLEAALQQAIQVFGIRWNPQKFQALDGRHVVTDQGHRLPAALVIGADGARSAVRSAAGISHDCKAYGDSGVVVHLDAGLAHQGAAVQWFAGDSILALLPMPDTAQGPQVSMVWSMPDAQARELLAMPPAESAAALEKSLLLASQQRLGPLKVRSRIFAFPLTLEHSGLVAPGVALVGDAAHRVHPLAGQGLNLGLGDVESLIDVLVRRERFRQPGDLRVLHRYRRARAEPVWAMRAMTDGLYRLFATGNAPLAWGRNLGMQCIDRLPGIKRLLIEAAR